MMRKVLLVLVTALAFSGCQSQERPKTLEEARGGLVFVGYKPDKPDMQWNEVSDRFGEPDVPLAPTPGMSVRTNARVYKNIVVIFHTESKEVKVGDKTRYVEIVTQVELGKKK